MEFLNWRNKKNHNFSARECVCKRWCNALTEERDIAIDTIMGLSELQYQEILLKENQAVKSQV